MVFREQGKLLAWLLAWDACRSLVTEQISQPTNLGFMDVRRRIVPGRFSRRIVSAIGSQANQAVDIQCITSEKAPILVGDSAAVHFPFPKIYFTCIWQ
jgi:hypothetical protein